jgi:hypothetical protein
MKTIDLSDLKVGDKAWSAAIGECRVTYIFEKVIQCDGTHEYYMNGIFYDEDIHPTLFHSEQEFREYWGFESNQLPTSAEIAMAAMQGILSNPNYSELPMEEVAKDAIKQADVMLTKLNEKQ